MLSVRVLIYDGLSKPYSITFEFTLKDPFASAEEVFPQDSKLFVGKLNAD